MTSLAGSSSIYRSVNMVPLVQNSSARLMTMSWEEEPLLMLLLALPSSLSGLWLDSFPASSLPEERERLSQEEAASPASPPVPCGI
jgi:hypothetical protein